MKKGLSAIWGQERKAASQPERVISAVPSVGKGVLPGLLAVFKYQYSNLFQLIEKFPPFLVCGQAFPSHFLHIQNPLILWQVAQIR